MLTPNINNRKKKKLEISLQKFFIMGHYKFIVIGDTTMIFWLVKGNAVFF